MGGASVCQQCIQASLADEVRIHLSPVLLGAGTPLFADHGDKPTRLEQTRVVQTPHAIHLFYRVAPDWPGDD